jgi:thymidylate synthase (FAD)
MKIIQPSFEIMGYTPFMTRLIELGIRTAYKSEDKIGPGTDTEIIGRIKNFKHESTLEHGSITVKFITDRGVTHELVRHRVASFTQESTRYCNYGKDKFDNQVTFIEPFFYVPSCNPNGDENTALYDSWKNMCMSAEAAYLNQLQNKAKPQEARSILPNSLKTEIVVTANIREWRHIAALRTSNAAHPQIRQIICPLLARFRQLWPILFDDVGQVDHECPAQEVENAKVNALRDFELQFKE